LADHIKLNDFSAGYRSEEILRKINAEIPKPGITTILGQNGSGKTTMLRSLIKYTAVKGGSITMAGKDLGRIPLNELPNYVAYAPAWLEDQMGFTALNIVSSARISGRWITEDEAAEVLEYLHIGYLAQKRFGELSSGQMKMVLIARALASRAPTVMLDEPTSGLDISNKRRIMKMIHMLAERKLSVVVATHDLDIALISDWIIAIKNGSIISSGARNEVISSALLSDLYDTNVRVVKLDNSRFTCVMDE
jgi:iron complex transport system ATP-binding protein